MMNQKISEQNWDNVKGEIQKSFTHLSAEELEKTHGDAKLLTDLISQREGLAHADAQKRLDEIVARYRAEAAASSFYEEDDFDDYINIEADADDERFGTDEGLTSPASRSFSGSASGRSEERMPRQDSPDATDKSSRKNVTSGRSDKPNRSPSSEVPTERRGPDTNPKKTDRNI